MYHSFKLYIKSLKQKNILYLCRVLILLHEVCVGNKRIDMSPEQSVSEKIECSL